LKNLKILDLSTVLAGPSVGTFFAELGAQVLKIENSNRPDVTRSWKLPSEDNKSNLSAYFSSINYKKKYLSLNLSIQEDYQDFMNLLKDADMLISNFKKGDDIKFNIEDKTLRKINPRLIIGKISGYGSESDRVAYDLILQAETGFMAMNGTKESGPVKMPVALIDVLAGHHLKEGLLLALLERQNSSIGQTVEVSLYDAAVCSLVNQASNYLMSGYVPQRIGSLHPNIAPYGEIFTTKDKEQITFAIGSDAHFNKLCSFLNLESLTNDLNFNTNQKRVINRHELYLILEARISEMESKIIFESLNSLHVPCGIIKSLDKVLENEVAQKLVREEIIENQLTKRITSIAFKWK
jgi:crotonobetainyl-CoA:carnitine CoA-transferase CaiB-like acyl-CoA transferase